MVRCNRLFGGVGHLVGTQLFNSRLGSIDGNKTVVNPELTIAPMVGVEQIINTLIDRPCTIQCGGMEDQCYRVTFPNLVDVYVRYLRPLIDPD